MAGAQLFLYVFLQQYVYNIVVWFPFLHCRCLSRKLGLLDNVIFQCHCHWTLCICQQLFESRIHLTCNLSMSYSLRSRAYTSNTSPYSYELSKMDPVLTKTFNSGLRKGYHPSRPICSAISHHHYTP